MSNKTKKVRIAVAINEDGEWYACGWLDYSHPDKEWDDSVKAGMATKELVGAMVTVHFIEAEVPIPRTNHHSRNHSAMSKEKLSAKELVDKLELQAVGMSVVGYVLRWPITHEIIARKEETAPILLDRLRTEDGWMLDITVLQAMFPDANPYTPEDAGAGFVSYKVDAAIEAWIQWGSKNNLIAR